MKHRSTPFETRSVTETEAGAKILFVARTGVEVKARLTSKSVIVKNEEESRIAAKSKERGENRAYSWGPKLKKR